MRKFRLLKDIPGIRAGAIFEASVVDNFYECINGRVSINKFALPDSVVEDNPGWFEEVKEQEKEFTKADMLAYAAYYAASLKFCPNDIELLNYWAKEEK